MFVRLAATFENKNKIQKKATMSKFKLLTKRKSAHKLLPFAVATLLLSGTKPAQAFEVVLNSGELTHTLALLTQWKWSSVASDMDMEMFIGPWSNSGITRAQRTTIMGYSNTNISVCESEYRSNGVNTSWVAQRKLPPTTLATINAGGSVEWVLLYNAGTFNGVPQAANISSLELQNAKNIFNENNQIAWHRSWATIVRSWNSNSPNLMAPFHGFLYEIRINDYNDDLGKRNQVNNAVKWGLDNGKSVFVQLIAPRGTNPQYANDYKEAMAKLRGSIGINRMKKSQLKIVCASYDSSGENVSSVPEKINGQTNQASTTGAAYSLLQNRTAIENGTGGW